MRCATVTNTSPSSPQRPVRTNRRATLGAPSAKASARPATHTVPTMNATAITRAWVRSSAWLCRSRPQNRRLIHTMASKARLAPASANVGCTWAPSNQTSQPSASKIKGGRSLRTGQGGTRSHLGPAVKRKPEKNRGKKPNTMSAPCAKAPGSTGSMAGAPATRDAWISAHHSADTASSSMARKKARRCGAISRCAARQRRSSRARASAEGLLGADGPGTRNAAGSAAAAQVAALGAVVAAVLADHGVRAAFAALLADHDGRNGG